MRRDRARSPRGAPDAGFATAETAVVLPALVLLAAMLVWGVVAAAAQIRCVDAARVGARAAARGDTDAVALARSAAPPGAEVRLVTEGESVRVTVAAHCPGPGGLAAVLSVRLGATAVSAREDTLTGTSGGVSSWPS
ncbi:TadE family type IV pilus minor pilin [Kitasatospora indigofera]|uniref:TadE family type IV pilus minor pilin n=1 Tax=Kitasatospora indigofera TaxID=67307 RepID=UPI00324EE3E7